VIAHLTLCSLRQAVWLVFVAILLMVNSTLAGIAPHLTIKDQAVLGDPIVLARLDTMGTREPYLLVATRANGDSLHFCIRMDGLSLDIIDTFYRCRHRPVVFDVQQDTHSPDPAYIVGIASQWPDTPSFSALVRVRGSGYSQVDTSLYPRQIRTALIDHISGDVWVGHVNDTSYRISYSPYEWYDYDAIEGYIIRYDGFGPDSVIISASRAGADMQSVYAGGGVSSPAVFWRDYYYRTTNQPVPKPSWAFVGVALPNADDSTMSALTWLTHGRYDMPYGAHAVLDFYNPVPLADVNGDGSLEAVLSSRHTWSWMGVNLPSGDALGVYQLTNEQSIWGTSLHPFRGGRIPRVLLWDVDGDELVDVLWIGDNPLGMLGFKGSTGDSLFAVDADPRLVSGLIGAGVLHELDGRSGLMYNRDTIFTFALDFVTSSVADNGETVPSAFALNQNYPNPFNASTTIRYSLPTPSAVTLSIHNILGQRVRVLANQFMPAGEHEVKWNGKDHGGSDVASGVYFIVMQTGGDQAVRKAMVVK